MRLVFLQANQAYAFVFGETPIALEGEPMFFARKEDALAAAKRRGLNVSRQGTVFARPQAGHPTRLAAASRPNRAPDEELPIVNPGDYAFNENLFLMSAGAYGEARGYVWANHLEDAFEEWVEWLDDHAPGHLMTVDEDDLKEAAEGLGIPWNARWPDYEDPTFYEVQEAAEVDLTPIGHTTLEHGTHIANWEWGGVEVDPGSDEYRSVRERSEQEVEELE